MIWKAPRIWEGGTAFILAGGPSLKGFDSQVLKGKGRVLAINDSWRLAPKADAFYFCDYQWWMNQQALNPYIPPGNLSPNGTSFHDLMYKGFWITSSPKFNDHPQVHALRLTGERGLETDPGWLKHGANSGYQCLNLAYHLGVKRIILLGYDMKVQGTRTHWHNEQRPAASVFQNTIEKSFLPCFDTLVEPLKTAGIEVINSTPDSALKCWPFVPLEDILNPQLSLQEN